MKPININLSARVKAAYDHCLAVEALPASEQATALSLEAGSVLNQMVGLEEELQLAWKVNSILREGLETIVGAKEEDELKRLLAIIKAIPTDEANGAEAAINALITTFPHRRAT